MGRVKNGSQERVRKAECRESGLLGLERGKGREALPIVTKGKIWLSLRCGWHRELVKGETANDGIEEQ
ncbi:hypothetical protein KSD_97350 [Ktedonobacter sp. SOSP1-85]|nr:hypothetical protein KSD_97350 [Ktedonobacter sp. SOSP1-85]